MTAVLDHLVVAAANLEQGVAWCEATLGVVPGPGGRHPLMGTHNRLFKISSPDYIAAYFEIIAIDPDAPPPGRARWFGLGEPGLQALVAQTPRLIHFVARTVMLGVDRKNLLKAGYQPGDPVAASRETEHGALSWKILVRADGQLNCRGALPTLIQWKGAHPTHHMPDSGVMLRSLALRGVGATAREVLRLARVKVLPGLGPAITATLSTPKGDVVLTSPFDA